MTKHSTHIMQTLTQNECDNIYAELEMRVPFIKDVNRIIDIQDQMNKIVRYRFAYKYYPFNSDSKLFVIFNKEEV